MKLDGTVMAVAMMMSSLAAVGCHAPAAANLRDTDGQAQTDTVAVAQPAPRADVAVDVAGSTSVMAPFAPPAPRYEVAGVAPFANGVFVRGYWRWVGREYVWVGGHWVDRGDLGRWQRARYEFVNGGWHERMEPCGSVHTGGGDRHDDRHADGPRAALPVGASPMPGRFHFAPAPAAEPRHHAGSHGAPVPRGHG